MKTSLRHFILLAAAVCLAPQAWAGCDRSGTSGEEVMGTLVGAALGGLVGAQIGHGTGRKVAIGAGVLAGGYLGNRIGNKLSCQDQEYHYDTTQSTLEYKPTGGTAAWVNPDTGHSGSVTPTKTYISSSGAPCRDFTQSITVDGERENIQATACRQPDGTWQMVGS
jgi:surface antigen